MPSPSFGMPLIAADEEPFERWQARLNHHWIGRFKSVNIDGFFETPIRLRDMNTGRRKTISSKR